jgi:TonB family protein
MKTRLANPSALFAGAEDETRRFMVMLGVSALGHLLLLGMFYVVPSSFDRPFRAGPRAINVDLVSLPASGPVAPAAEAPAPAPPPAPQPKAAPPEPVPVPQPPPPVVKKEQVSIAPPKKKPKVVKSLKKKTAPKKKSVAAVTRPAPQAKKPQRSQTVNSAIEAMKKKVAGQEKAQATAGAGGSGSGAGVGVMDRIRNYQFDVGLSVGQNFAFPQQLARSVQDLATLITFRVLPNGEIIDVKIFKSSGNNQLDEAAYRAVLKSSPVRPHPDGITKPYIEVGLRCTPTGVQ